MILATLAQAQHEFFPTSVSGWVGLVGQSVALLLLAIGFVVKFIRAPLMQDMQTLRERDLKDLRGHVDSKAEEHGKRIGHVETECEKSAARIHDLDRSDERLHLQLTSLAEAFGRVDAHLKSLSQKIEVYHEQRMTESGSLRERLASIDTRLSYLPGAPKQP